MGLQSVALRWDGTADDDVHDAAVRGMTMWAEHVLELSNEKVPIDEATLERSGAATVDEAELVGHVSYDTPYAVRQHEHLEWRHAPGRAAKFLENALNASADVGPAIVAKQIRQATR